MTAANVLVVDDSALARAVIVRHLSAEGYALREACSGEEALAACAEAVPDVILMDVEMPGLDGHATLRRLEADPALDDIPVVFLTGRTDAVDVAEGLRLGAHDDLGKPFEGIELIARVRAAVRMRELQAELRERNAELEHLVAVDGLTGLYNRRHLEEQAARALSRLRRHGGWMAVTILDVDSFKAVNDTHGHAVGDAVLIEVARRLEARLRQEDVLGRWGGEEFVVLAADTDAVGGARLAERLREAVAAGPVLVERLELSVTVSAGWAAVRDGADFDTLVRTADRELYAAKADGRNTVHGTELAPG